MTKLEFIQNQLLMHATKMAACNDWAKGEDNSGLLQGDERWLMFVYRGEQRRLREGWDYMNRPATFQKMEDFQ